MGEALMIVIISPSKTLDFSEKANGEFGVPNFLEQSELLIDELKKLSKEDISSLMKLSHKLTELNYDRYRSFKTPFAADNARQCLFAFKGDVYEGLDAETFSDEDVEYAQEHLRILSGLYGCLQPLDLIQPYRLEMGTKLKNLRGKNLYDFWGGRVTEKLNDSLEGEGGVLVNLASNEYWKVVQPKQIKGQVITPAFKEYKNGDFKMVALFAKRARGLMSRFIIRNRVEKIEDLKKFNLSGYEYNSKLSTDEQPVFTR